jgi:cell wall-associated NlpC family hydrolase
MSAETARARVQGAIEELRAALGARHGWTFLEVSARIEDETRRIALHGEVAVDRLVERVVATVRAVSPGWSVEGEGLRPMSGGSWHALPGAAVLLGECPGVHATRRVATELRVTDGPVQRLGEARGVIVVRGRDGTVGWLEGPLGPEVGALCLAPPHGEDQAALVLAAASWLDVPYRLGGVTDQGVDCSGLAQRLVRDAFGVLLPRHSSDQLFVGSRAGHRSGVGDLVFVWGDREAPCHVGIGTGATVVHASLSRRCVVEDPLDGFLAGTVRVMHVPFAELLAFGRRVAGQPSLTTAGFRLGRDATT